MSSKTDGKYATTENQVPGSLARVIANHAGALAIAKDRVPSLFLSAVVVVGLEGEGL